MCQGAQRLLKICCFCYQHCCICASVHPAAFVKKACCCYGQIQGGLSPRMYMVLFQLSCFYFIPTFHFTAFFSEKQCIIYISYILRVSVHAADPSRQSTRARCQRYKLIAVSHLTTTWTLKVTPMITVRFCVNCCCCS